MEKERQVNGVEPEKSEDDIQREQLGPRGVPGAPDPAKMTQTSSDAVTDRPEFIANPAKSERMLCAQVKFNSSKTMVMPKQGASRLLRFASALGVTLRFTSVLCRYAGKPSFPALQPENSVAARTMSHAVTVAVQI